MIKIKNLIPAQVQTAAASKINLADVVSRKELSSCFEYFDNSDLMTSLKKKAQGIAAESLGIIGIGGSTVGTKALYEIFGSLNGKKLFFFDNLEPWLLKTQLESLNLEKTHWFIVSKSGTTFETLAMTDFIREIYTKKNFSFYDRCTVCTEDRKNPLKDWADQNKIANLPLNVNVGGRFSVFTPVGLFPLAFCGHDLNVTPLSLAQNSNEIVYFCEQVIQSWKESKNLTYFWFYSSRCHSIVSWLEQLWAESLEKKTTKDGIGKPKAASVPIGAIGANDQHSLLQQIAEGPNNKLISFFTFKDLEQIPSTIQKTEFQNTNFYVNKNIGELLVTQSVGTEKSLIQHGLSTMHFEIESHSFENICQLFQFFMTAVVVLGDYLDINVFDQPGVELGKKMTKEILLAD